MADEHKNTILILNSGSSSLKFGLFAPGYEDEEQLLSGSAEGIERESEASVFEQPMGPYLGNSRLYSNRSQMRCVLSRPHSTNTSAHPRLRSDTALFMAALISGTISC